MSEPRFPIVKVVVQTAQADGLSGLLFSLGASGVETQDDDTFVKGPGNGAVRLVASFTDENAASLAATELSQRNPTAEVEQDVLVGDAWRDGYKEYFKPFCLCGDIWVVPPWIEDPAEHVHESNRATVLWMDPGRAFGTGTHATTALISRSLMARRELLAGLSVLDVGTGSGILALVALTLGAATVRAIDNDPSVVEVAQKNAALNDLDANLHVDAAPIEAIKETYPLVLANIQTKILVPMAADLSARVAPGGTLILSGILESHVADIRAAYDDKDLVFVEQQQAAGEIGPGEVDSGAPRDCWVAMTYAKRGATG